MGYTVYIIESLEDGRFYKGYTSDIEKRLWEHNHGISRYTRNKWPWKLVFQKMFDDKSEAQLFERRIKRFNSTSLQNLISSYSENP